jgi:hypothetical protein
MRVRGIDAAQCERQLWAFRDAVTLELVGRQAPAHRPGGAA